MSCRNVDIIFFHVDIIYLACRGKKYATIIMPTESSRNAYSDAKIISTHYAYFYC